MKSMKPNAQIARASLALTEINQSIISKMHHSGVYGWMLDGLPMDSSERKQLEYLTQKMENMVDSIRAEMGFDG